MAVRLATSADNARLWTLFQAFYTAHPEAFDRPITGMTAQDLQAMAAGWDAVYVYTDAQNVVQGAMGFRGDTIPWQGQTVSVLTITLGFYNPQFSALQVKPVIDNLAHQMYTAAGNRGFQFLRGCVMDAYTAGVNYWSSYGLIDQAYVIHRQPQDMAGWYEAVVPLTRYAQGVV